MIWGQRKKRKVLDVVSIWNFPWRLLHSHRKLEIKIEMHLTLTGYKQFRTEYENLRKAILENNVNITKRIINDLGANQATVVNFAPKGGNSLLFM